MKDKKELTPEDKYKREKIKNALLVAAAIGLVVWSMCVEGSWPITNTCVLLAVVGFWMCFEKIAHPGFEIHFSQAITWMMLLALFAPLAVIEAFRYYGKKGNYTLIENEMLFVLIAATVAFTLLVFISFGVILDQEDKIKRLEEYNEALRNNGPFPWEKEIMTESKEPKQE